MKKTSAAISFIHLLDTPLPGECNKRSERSKCNKSNKRSERNK
jgi:hypothetical protein